MPRESKVSKQKRAARIHIQVFHMDTGSVYDHIVIWKALKKLTLKELNTILKVLSNLQKAKKLEV